MLTGEFAILFARNMAKAGEEMNLQISHDHDQLLSTFQDSDSFDVSVAHAFAWTGHAVGKPGYFEAAVDYLTTGRLESLEAAEVYSERFGPKSLASGLEGWKAISEQLGRHDFLSCDAQELSNIQQKCLGIAKRLIDQKLLSGMGSWQFCAPFKIVAIQRKDLWQNESLDKVLMPLGLEVNRGIIKLFQKNHAYIKDYDSNMISEEEGDLIDDMGIVELVHGISNGIARDIESRILHVNSGLYKYGKGKL